MRLTFLHFNAEVPLTPDCILFYSYHYTIFVVIYFTCIRTIPRRLSGNCNIKYKNSRQCTAEPQLSKYSMQVKVQWLTMLPTHFLLIKFGI